MNSNDIPENIRSLIIRCIDSVEQLEVLALLRADAEREWTAASLSQELRSTEGSVSKRLNDLVNRKVLLPLPEGPFKYRPYSEEVDKTVGELVDFYRLRPFRVMDFLFSKPVDAMQSFADAFRFKKDDK